jgi:hypothetical protein
MKYMSLVIKTTGKEVPSGQYAGTNQILEFGAVIDDTIDRESIDSLPRFHRYLLYERISGEPYDLAMNAEVIKRIANKEEGWTYCKPNELGKQLKDFLQENGICEKVTAAGKNFASFTKPYLMTHTGFANPAHGRILNDNLVEFHDHSLDPAIMYWNPAEDEVLPDTAACSWRAGLADYSPHTALEHALIFVRLIRFKIHGEA